MWSMKINLDRQPLIISLRQNWYSSSLEYFQNIRPILGLKVGVKLLRVFGDKNECSVLWRFDMFTWDWSRALGFLEKFM